MNGPLKHWLVEIRQLGDAAPVAFEQVMAVDAPTAMAVGHEQFLRKARYEPALRRILQQRMVDASHCYTADVVEITE